MQSSRTAVFPSKRLRTIAVAPSLPWELKPERPNHDRTLDRNPPSDQGARRISPRRWLVDNPAASGQRPIDLAVLEEDKIELVRELWPNPAISTAEICRRTGRSINAVKHQARNIGVQRSAGRPKAKVVEESVDLGEQQTQPRANLLKPWEIPPSPTVAAPNEIISTGVADPAVAARMPDRDPLPAPRKGKRGGIDRTGDMMGDPGHANRREIEAQYSKDAGGLG